MLPQQFASSSHLCFWNLLYNSHEFFVCDPANGTQENYMYVSTCILKTSIYTNWTSPTFNFLDFSYFSLSLCPFSELLAARKTYLKSFWLIGSFQKANHVTVLSCLTSFQLQDTWTIKHCLHAICKHSLYTTDQGKWYLSPGIGHSGTGAPFPIFIVISLGRMRRFSFPIWNNVKKKPKNLALTWQRKARVFYKTLNLYLWMFSTSPEQARRFYSEISNLEWNK